MDVPLPIWTFMLLFVVDIVSRYKERVCYALFSIGKTVAWDVTE